jgi:hypothetical protein
VTTLCNITGVLRDTEGNALANKIIKTRRQSGVVGSTVTIVPEQAELTTDGSGNADWNLYAGQYACTVVTDVRTERFYIGVPDAATANLHELVDQIAPVTSYIQGEAVAAKDRAIAAAAAAEADADLTAADLLLTNADVVLISDSEAATAADRIATAADVVTTNDDAIATAADRVATNQDTIDTAADVTATNADAAATAQDVIDTAADRAAVADDLVLTAADTVATAADRVQTGLDAAATAQDVIDTAADLAATNQDTIDTAADLALTNADVVLTGLDADATAADVLLTAADASSTAADVLLTAADVSSTAADVVLTNADVVTTNADAATTTQDAIDTAADALATAADLVATAQDVIDSAANRDASIASKMEWQGSWVTSTTYALRDVVYEAGSSYVCVVAHTSGTFSTDLAAVKWEIVAQKGLNGEGSGDMLAANNGSDFADIAAVAANLGLEIGVDVQAYSAVLANTTASFLTADATKLDNIEALADVTDETNVTAAGALMDSEVTNLADVKAFAPADYATAAQGTVAETAVQPTATETLSGKTITNLILDGSVTEEVFAVTGTTPALDPANGTIQTWTLSGASTPTESLAAGESLTIMIDDGTANAITWPTITWVNNGATAPTLATSGYTVIALWKVSTTLYGALIGSGA